MSENPKAQYGARKIGFAHVPFSGFYLLSLGLYQGWKKYGILNWRRTSVSMTVYLDAIERHYLELVAGIDVAEDGTFNLAHIVANCTIIFDAWLFGTLIDDRIKSDPEVSKKLAEISLEQRARMDTFVAEFEKQKQGSTPSKPVRGLSRYFYWRR